MSEIHQLTATQIRDLITTNKLTVEEYAHSLLTHIQARDPIIKAWVHLNAAQVLTQARHLDQIPPAKRGPLHGVAIGIKDVILTKDMPTKYASAIHTNAPASTTDAAIVTTLRAAGALIVGKTATTEFAATHEGGPCTNPHNPLHTPGGSSSGSAAAVADFQVPVAVGTQTGGSIVRPAGFCGVWGFKPTWSAISREGISHVSITCDTAGFFARSVDDLELLADVFNLTDDEPVPRSPYSVSGARIAFAKTHVWPKAGPGLVVAWERAKDLLVAQGAQIEEIELPGEFENLREWHGVILKGEGRAEFRGQYLLSKDKLSRGIVDTVESKATVSQKALLESYDGAARLRPMWDSIASRYDAVIVPSTVDEAQRGLEYTGDSSFCSMWTLLHVPALHVPGLFGEGGLPVGLTVVGGRHVLYVGRGIGGVLQVA